jgi:PhnB protein
MAINDTFWGAKFGMPTDKFGVQWMFNGDLERRA